MDKSLLWLQWEFLLYSHSSTDRAVTKQRLARFALKQGIKRPCQPTLQQDTVSSATIPQPLCYSRRYFRSHSANTQWGQSGFQRCDSDWDDSCCSFVIAKDWEGFSCAWYIWQRCFNQQEWWYSGLRCRRVSLNSRVESSKQIASTQTVTKGGDNKSATVLQSEQTAGNYKKCWFIVTAELTDMRCCVVWVTACIGNLQCMDSYR